MAAQSYTQTLENKMDKVGSLTNMSAYDESRMIEWQHNDRFPKTLTD